MGLSIDRKKIVKGLEYHLKELSIGKTCFECPYLGNTRCEIHLIADALDLLKEQEGRIVKCGECIHSIPSLLDGFRRCSKNDGYWADDDYCSKGKRREE